MSALSIDLLLIAQTDYYKHIIRSSCKVSAYGPETPDFRKTQQCFQQNFKKKFINVSNLFVIVLFSMATNVEKLTEDWQ